MISARGKQLDLTVGSRTSVPPRSGLTGRINLDPQCVFAVVKIFAYVTDKRCVAVRVETDVVIVDENLAKTHYPVKFKKLHLGGYLTIFLTYVPLQG